MAPRIHVIARDHDTARHNPTYLEEDIMPMEKDEFNGPYKLLTWAVIGLMSALFWIAFIQWARS